MTAPRRDSWRSLAVFGGLTTPPDTANGGLVADTGLCMRQPTPPDTAKIPSRVCARARKAKRRDRGFNFRNAARILNLALLAKLPGTSASPGLFDQQPEQEGRGRG